jgi:Short C-terminal domain
MPGLIRGVARTAVVAGTATAVSGRVRRRQEGRWAQQESQQAPPPPPQQAYAPPPPPPPPPPAPAQDDTIAKLKELAQLKEQGILTDEEFAAQKARVLGG